MSAFMIALLALTGFNCVVWVLFVVGAWIGSKDTRFRIDPEPVKGTCHVPQVSVIIPARDEAGVISKAVQAVLSQDLHDLTLIVIDDNSRDGTGEIAHQTAPLDPRLTVLQGASLPDGWRGKCWALWQAQKSAEGDLLLFVDADVTLDPCAVRRACEVLLERDLDLLSAWGTWQMNSFWERVAMPVVGGFVRGTHPLETMNDPERTHDAFANGQFILMRREAYDRFGGHEAIRNEVLEDVELARRAKEKGLRCGMFHAPRLFRVRMYNNLRAVWLGFVKNFYLGMRQNTALALVAAAFLSFTTLLPWAALGVGIVCDNTWVWGLALGSLALMHIFRWMQDQTYEVDARYGWTHTMGSCVLIGIIIHSAWRGVTGGTTTWKGRAV